MQSDRPTRLMLWVDGVGGYLVCLADSVVLGQPVWSTAPSGLALAGGNGVAAVSSRQNRRVRGPDVPILGDLHARHARLVRDGEAYLLEAIHSAMVDGQPVSRSTTLSDGSEITLGRNVRLRMRQPHALSSTARLELLGNRRTEPAADAVLLMSDACVLGPRSDCHVVCRRWTDEVVLSRRGGRLFCRVAGQYEVDGSTRSGRSEIGPKCRISSESFSLSLEPVV